MTKVYIAGPMRGYDYFNFPAFDEAAASLRAMGYEVVNPAEIDRGLGLDETADDAEVKFEALGGIETAMHRDFGVILECDGIVLLPGWEKSTGARGELFVAQTTGRTVHTYQRESFGVVLAKYEGPGPVLQLPTPAKIIGLSGYARSGKDTIAGFAAEFGWERRAFADKLKEFLYAQDPAVVYGMDLNETVYGPLSTMVNVMGWEEAKEVAPDAYGSVRKVLQRLGTEAGRKILGENVWVDAVMSTLEVGGRYIFTDVRFENEAQAIKDRGGSIWRITRPGFEPVNAHPSETALDSWEFDRFITNYGDLDTLREITRGSLTS